MRFKSLLLFALGLFAAHCLFAHAMWIETSLTGKKGKAQDVKIFFGEFSDKDITPTEKWFSDISQFTLVAIAPDKSEIKLSATADKDFYRASFTPAQSGVYTIAMKHTVKDPYNKMKLDYNSSVTILVDNQFAGNEALQNGNPISLFSDLSQNSKANQPVTVIAVYKNQLAEGQKVKIIAPNGWEKELYSNEKGEVSFTPLWPGTYMAEFAYTDNTPGDINGKPYESVWQMATHMIIVR